MQHNETQSKVSRFVLFQHFTLKNGCNMCYKVFIAIHNESGFNWECCSNLSHQSKKLELHMSPNRMEGYFGSGADNIH